MELLVVPAIIANSQEELDGMIKSVTGKAKRVMLDVMDGKFVKNTSLLFDFKLPGGIEYEAHLMVENPLDWVEKNGHKVHVAIIQVESVENIVDAIEFLKKKGLKITLALNPETSLEVIRPYLKDVDAILVMTVHPGTFCVQFLPETMGKVRELRKMDKEIPIEVDGCMNLSNAKIAKEAGATIFASGSFIIKSDNPSRAIDEMKNSISED